MFNKAIVWSKDGCGFCVRAKHELNARGIVIEERSLSSGQWTKEQLLEQVPSARTLPQIFLDDAHIGGYDQLVKVLGSTDAR